jgi:hypothetical protein
MNAAGVATPVEADGELHLTEWPCRRGDKVEVIVLILEQPCRPASDVEREKARAAAVDQFLALARSSSIRSASPYPTGARASELKDTKPLGVVSKSDVSGRRRNALLRRSPVGELVGSVRWKCRLSNRFGSLIARARGLGGWQHGKMVAIWC